jgi:hypothetical protein
MQNGFSLTRARVSGRHSVSVISRRTTAHHRSAARPGPARFRAWGFLAALREVLPAARAEPACLYLHVGEPAAAPGVPVVTDLPGVGANPHDHPLITPLSPVTSGPTLLDVGGDTW